MAENPYSVTGSHAAISSWKVTPDTWGRNVYELTVHKHFIQAGEIIYSTDLDGNLVEPIEGATPTEADYLDKGMDDFQGLFTPRTRVNYKMGEVEGTSEGMIYNKKVNPTDFKRAVVKMKVEV